MENPTLLNLSALDHGRIDYGTYTLSLIQEARRIGLLDQSDTDRMEAGLLALLRAQIAKITHGESSSVPAELADELMDGIGYCIDLALGSLPTPHEGIALLKAKSTMELWQMGADLLNAQAKRCDALLSRVRATRTKTVNTAYAITLDQTLPDLLRGWKSSPFPHDFLVLTEYPLARESRLSGIFAVHDRLAALALENRFCARFSDGLDALLRQFARQNTVTPADAYVNLFTIALRNLLLNLLIGRECLPLDAQDATGLEERLAPLDATQRQSLVAHAAGLLLERCAFENEKLEQYVRDAADDFADALNRTDGRLDALAVVGAPEPVSILEDGEQLDDDTFAQLADELLLCENAQEKVDLLLGEVHALSDLRDMLASDLLFNDEYRAVYALLPATVLALLLTRADCETIDGQLYPRIEIEWQLKLARYVNEGADGHTPEILRLYRDFQG